MARTVLVTGASSGIGEETASTFCSKGWQVIWSSRHREHCEKAIRRSGVARPRCIPLEMDVTDSRAVSRKIRRLGRDLHGLDVIVSNAGVGAVGRFTQFTPNRILRVFQVNVFGAIYVVRASIPVLKEGARIILVSSRAALEPEPFNSIYSASKAALTAFGRAIAKELKAKGIQVVVVCPDRINTPLMRRSERKYSELASDYEAVPVSAGERSFWGTPADVAELIYLIANCRTTGLTGQVVALGN